MFPKDLSGIKWIILFVGIVSFIIGVDGLITGEAMEPSKGGRRGVMRIIDDDEPAFAAVIFWNFVIAIGCFLFLWVFRRKESKWY